MNCTPDPTVTCGTTNFDTCIIGTNTWPSCYPTLPSSCYRQSEFNSATGTLLCSINTSVTNILASINLSSLISSCSFTASKTTVVAEFQAIYNALCSLETNLNLPVTGLDLKCLQQVCNAPIGTLGSLLQALINQACGNQTLTYTATVTQTGTAAPVATVLENTFVTSGITLTWARTSAGVYTLTSTGGTPFTANKTVLLIGVSQTTDIIKFVRTSTNILTVQSNTATDGELHETTIQIKIYP